MVTPNTPQSRPDAGAPPAHLVPIVVGELVWNSRLRRYLRVTIARCPWCGNRHTHGTGHKPGDPVDVIPRDLGTRLACLKAPAEHYRVLLKSHQVVGQLDGGRLVRYAQRGEQPVNIP